MTRGEMLEGKVDEMRDEMAGLTVSSPCNSKSGACRSVNVHYEGGLVYVGISESIPEPIGRNSHLFCSMSMDDARRVGEWLVRITSVEGES